jgi:diaminopropionate ammonia-lyase
MDETAEGEVADDSPRVLLRLWRSQEPTPLVDSSQLAERFRVARVYLKDESRRPLGSFKALGGMYAGLRALARSVGSRSIAALVAERRPDRKLPTLLCASDGNHGLAVAAAAETAGGLARIYLHQSVPESRARRIRERGAEIVWIAGTYDDAVDAADAAGRRGEGLLVSDTSADAGDVVTQDVMIGYSLMADEIVDQLRWRSADPPTHLFVQAGVGGLAAALARGIREANGLTCRIVVVEPERAACVGHALRTRRIERLPGDLQTAAEMLSCGEASAPAVEILRRVQAAAVAVSEQALHEAVDVLSACGGPPTTPSGACGLAGLLAARANVSPQPVSDLDATSRVLLIVTEGALPEG